MRTECVLSARLFIRKYTCRAKNIYFDSKTRLEIVFHKKKINFTDSSSSVGFHIYIYIYIYIRFFQSIYPVIYLYIFLFIYLSINQSIYLHLQRKLDFGIS